MAARGSTSWHHGGTTPCWRRPWFSPVGEGREAWRANGRPSARWRKSDPSARAERHRFWKEITDEVPLPRLALLPWAEETADLPFHGTSGPRTLYAPGLGRSAPSPAFGRGADWGYPLPRREDPGSGIQPTNKGERPDRSRGNHGPAKGGSGGCKLSIDGHHAVRHDRALRHVRRRLCECARRDDRRRRPGAQVWRSGLSVSTPELSHRFRVVGGVLEKPCRELLVDLFEFRRNSSR